MVASSGCSSLRVGSLFQKPLSPKPRALSHPFQHVTTHIPSVDWGVNRRTHLPPRPISGSWSEILGQGITYYLDSVHRRIPISLFDPISQDPTEGALNNANSVITLLHDNFSLAKRFGDDAIAAFAGDHERYGGWVDEIRQYLTRAEHSLGAATHQYNSMPAAGDVPRPNAEQLLQLLREQAQRLPEHIRARVQRSRLENERQQQAMRIIDSAQSIHHALLTTVEIIRRGRANRGTQHSLATLLRHATQTIECTLSVGSGFKSTCKDGFANY